MAVRILAPLAALAAAWLHGCQYGTNEAEQAFAAEKADAVIAIGEQNAVLRATYENDAREISTQLRAAEDAARAARKSLQERIADAKRSNQALIACAPPTAGGEADPPLRGPGRGDVRPVLTVGAVRLYDEVIRAALVGATAAASPRGTEETAAEPSNVGLADLLAVHEENMGATGTCYRRVNAWEAWARKEGLWK